AKHSELRSMLEDEPDSDEEVSLKLRDALESFFDKEHPKEASRSSSGPPEYEQYQKQGSVILESENYNMDQKEKAFHPVSGLGTEYTFDSMDSVESDLSGASFSDENRDLSESPHDVTPGKYMFVNVAEEIVRSKVPAMMRDYDMCTCERCTNDVVALTLNRIPPKYVVTMKGKLYARINACLPQYQTDMLAAITAACQTVKNNSRHNSAPDRLK
ncbi:MAG: late competence development ComFB family protein, partial [Anaerovoracaceae bacterium]